MHYVSKGYKLNISDEEHDKFTLASAYHIFPAYVFYSEMVFSHGDKFYEGGHSQESIIFLPCNSVF